MEHCSVVVSHGGSGTFLAALAAGLPQACIPQAADQFVNAQGCANSGAGVQLLPGAVSPDAVEHAVRSLLADASFQRAALGVSQEIAAMPSAATVAEQLHAMYG
jgi:UDP:flavonoid glycosyltransferase YjiC (YdhE family)